MNLLGIETTPQSCIMHFCLWGKDLLTQGPDGREGYIEVFRTNRPVCTKVVRFNLSCAL